jgi:hypothetical protein
MAKYSYLIFFLFVQFAISQDTLCVFRVNGSVLKLNSGQIQPLKKGDYIVKSDKIMLEEASNILTIDKNGVAYMLGKKGSHSFSNVLSNKETKTKSGLTSKYFKLIWRELKRAKASHTLIGGVFRGEQLMLYPRDNIKIAGSVIEFLWESAEKNSDYYLFIRDTKNDKLSKFKLNITSFSIYKSSTIFANSKFFEWCVTTEEFPNLDNLPFFSFELISKSEYQNLRQSYQGLVFDLQSLNFDNNTIYAELCKAYGLCKN